MISLYSIPRSQGSAGATRQPTSNSTPPTTLPPLTPSSRGSRSSAVPLSSPAAGMLSPGRSRSARSPPKLPSHTSTPEKRPGSVGSPYAQSHDVSVRSIVSFLKSGLVSDYFITLHVHACCAFQCADTIAPLITPTANPKSPCCPLFLAG
jgi:hypothetical protein